MRTLFLVNPTSGRGRTLALLPQLKELLGQFRLEGELWQTKAPGQAADLACRAAVEGYDRLVAVGGDGTLHEIVNGLLAAGLGQRLILGIIPSGSGNDFAYALGISPDLAVACALLQNGAERRVDAGRVTVDGVGRFFMNNVGMGLDAETTIKSAGIRWLRGHSLYLWSALQTIAYGQWPYDLQFSLDGVSYLQPVTLLTVSNGTRVGGGFRLTPTARLDDGLLDVCYAGGLSRWTLLGLLPRAVAGSHLDHPAVRLARVEGLEIRSEAGIPAYVDGEILGTTCRHFLFEVLPGALRVWA